ncbi:hypothetical protein BLNAU_21558 [Blattamonas nauphoetae]|uniref:Uncharacterized protein n=1 Tax=Blattamonas nauphoetae TaxID=2049346 RepID=A0ABQ9WVJ7_9EUKA|nr:hypothetical protein BLNAU_21558 [Blattamonas nauphoetae]
MSHHPLQQPTLDQFSAHTTRLARRCNLSTPIDDSLLQIESTNDDPKDDEIAQTPQRSHARAAKSREEQFAMFDKSAKRDEVRFLDQRSTFTVEADGMWCRICHRYRHFLHTTGQYVTEPSTPGHVNSVSNHVKTNIHAQATTIWIQDNP